MFDFLRRDNKATHFWFNKVESTLNLCKRAPSRRRQVIGLLTQRLNPELSVHHVSRSCGVADLNLVSPSCSRSCGVADLNRTG